VSHCQSNCARTRSQTGREDRPTVNCTPAGTLNPARSRCSHSKSHISQPSRSVKEGLV
jgi:hypothetical protein